MTIGGLPSPHSLTGFLRYLKNVSQGWPVSWMAPTYSFGQEMVSIYLIKIKIPTKFFNFVFLPYISFIMAFKALECIKRYWKTICGESF